MALLRTFPHQRTQITPSRYRLELGISTAERLQQAGDLEVENLVSDGDTAHAALVFAPRAVVFQNYKPNDQYVAKFTVRNTSLVCVLILYTIFILFSLCCPVAIAVSRLRLNIAFFFIFFMLLLESLECIYNLDYEFLIFSLQYS